MVNFKSLASPGIALALGIVSPFLPRFGGQPFLALAIALIVALVIPAKSRFGQAAIFMFTWAIFFTLSFLFLGGSA
jgi:hypothetical protein